MAGINNFLAAQAAAFANDESGIRATLQELLRDHFNEALDIYPSPPPNGPVMGMELSRQLALSASEALRQDGDVLCAELLQAAIQLSQDLPDSGGGAINRFLCSTVQLLVDEGADTAVAFRTRLETVLLKLSQKRWYGGEQSLPPIDTDGDAISTATDEPCLILCVGDQQVTATFTEVLATFWESRLDTSCHACELPIVGQPPIRTISSVSPTSDLTCRVHARVTNRHFSCLKASNVSWIPVSHVWEESIRTANQSQAHHDDAASTVLKTLETLLDASLDAYEPGTEFWHDYFSVPQWDRPIQQALLLHIPSIYHDAQEILIHMPDLPGGYILMLMPAGPTEFSATAALRFMPALQILCSSQWMERMWVLLEYSLCRRACVMDKSDYIWRRAPSGHRQGNNVADTFTTLVRNGHNVLLGLFRYAKSFASGLKDGFLAGLTDKQEQPQKLCLGEALELIARTKCQIFRDRFLAINMLLHRDAPPTSDTIPGSSVEACRWVWETALNNGDFSPLLLQPRERHQQSNPHVVGLLSYLTGYNDLEAAEWGLGEQRAPPQYTVAFGPNGVVETKMDFVGEIEAIHYLDPEESGEVAGVGTAMEILSSLDTARRLTAADLFDGLNRIFPFDVIHTIMAQLVGNVAYTLEARQAQDRRFTSKVDRCIAEFLAAPPGGAQRRFVAQRVTQLLKYDTHIAGNISAEITRLTKSRHIARSRRARGAAGGEPICAVRCPEAACQALTVLRLDLRDTGKAGDKVYRFPGL